jgi:hypothetical protein
VNNNFDDALDDLKKFMFSDESLSEKRSEANKNSLNLLLD